VLVALDPETGERFWKHGRYGHGQFVRVGDLLLIQAEDGEVVLVETTPEEHRELTELPALAAKTWNPPALSGSLLLVRNDREAAAYELPLAAGGRP
jgi:outer membrane protein assembly factor BamB